MGELYGGLTCRQWAIIVLLACVNVAWTLERPISVVGLALGFGLAFLATAFLARLLVGVYRYLYYKYIRPDQVPRSTSLNRERPFFTISVIAVVSFAAIFTLAMVDPSASVDSDNPYGKETLVVSTDSSNLEQEHEIALRNGLEYWEGNTSEEYAGYSIQYEYVRNADDPDILVEWEDEIVACGDLHQSNISGCADVVSDTAPDTTLVRIEAGHPHDRTVRTVKHEIGHTLGLGHDDEPQEIMSKEQIAHQSAL